MTRLLVLALLLALLLPAAAGAQQGPFGPLPQPTQAPPPVPEQSDDPFGQDVGTTTLYVIAGALLVAFVGIGLFISRDARRSLPSQGRESRSRLREEGPHKHERRAKAKARARGRSQREARRRNR